MKSSAIFFALLSIASAKLVVRQETANPTITSAAPMTTPDTSPQALCLAACDAADVDCRAHCVGAAHPNSAQVSQTNECIVGCPAGNGTAAETDRYNSCVRDCINSYYLSGQSVGIITPGVPATGTPSVSASATSTGSGSSQSTGGSQTTRSATYIAGSTGSPSGSAAPTATSNAASGPTIGSAGGLAGLFLALIAL